jgi:hypothetical protein
VVAIFCGVLETWIGAIANREQFHEFHESVGLDDLTTTQ